MNNNTKVRIYGSKALFESIAKEILAEAGGKSPAQKMTDKMMGKKKVMKMDEGEDSSMGDKNFTYADATGRTKFVTAANIDQAKEKVKKFGGNVDSVKEKTAALPIAPKKMEEGESNDSDFITMLYKDVVNLINEKYPDQATYGFEWIFTRLANEATDVVKAKEESEED